MEPSCNDSDLSVDRVPFAFIQVYSGKIKQACLVIELFFLFVGHLFCFNMKRRFCPDNKTVCASTFSRTGLMSYRIFFVLP
jgi:hypothetical protein